MKRIYLLIILLICLPLFGQTDLTQNEAAIRGIPDLFYIFKYGDSQIAANVTWNNVKYDTSLYSAIYYTMPYVTITATVIDTNTAADSVKAVLKLYQSNIRDTTRMVFVKNLRWTDEYGSTVSTDTLDATGEWACNFNESEFRSDVYFIVKLFTYTGHRKKNNGVGFNFKANGR
ncbi:MAG TPA: hypothetical protein VMV56_07560 [Williamwhitmania sp.]|nr:hypothetical protein [Williamwhitmania sp.]